MDKILPPAAKICSAEFDFSRIAFVSVFTLFITSRREREFASETEKLQGKKEGAEKGRRKRKEGEKKDSEQNKPVQYQAKTQKQKPKEKKREKRIRKRKPQGGGGGGHARLHDALLVDQVALQLVVMDGAHLLDQLVRARQHRPGGRDGKKKDI
jgi:hypothetical protein